MQINGRETERYSISLLPARYTQDLYLVALLQLCTLGVAAP